MNNKGIVIWVGGFVGVLFLYAAYKSSNTHLTTPWNIIASSIGKGGGGNTAIPPVAAPYAQLAPSSYDNSGATIQSGGVYYSQTYNGAIGDPLPASYQGNPHNYIPRTVDSV